MNRKLVIAVVIIAVIALFAIGAWYFTSPAASNSGNPKPIIVAYSPFESSGLFLIADDQKFFNQNGLNLTLYKSNSGAAALDDMLSGKADIAVSVSEYPFARKVFTGTPARAVASMDKTEYIYIVARKDRGIVNFSDIKGKKIGIAKGSIAEFYLGRFLTLHGLSIKDVSYIRVTTPSETADSVVNGSLDAGVLAQPYANQARDRLGTNAVVWPAQNNQPLYALVVSTEGWISSHPEDATRFLKALADAEEYVHTHPVEAKAIVQKQLNLDPGYMDTVWKQNQFSLTLDQSFISAMEDEARWMIANNLTNATALPDFRNYIYTKGLDEIKPGSVRIIG